jgi:hypothetical protein
MDECGKINRKDAQVYFDQCRYQSNPEGGAIAGTRWVSYNWRVY